MVQVGSVVGQVGTEVGQVETEVGQVTEVILTHRMLWLALHRVSRPHRTYGGMGWHSAAEVAEEVGVAEQVSALPEIPSCAHCLPWLLRRLRTRR